VVLSEITAQEKVILLIEKVILLTEKMIFLTEKITFLTRKITFLTETPKFLFKKARKLPDFSSNCEKNYFFYQKNDFSDK
jgi:hypothetical protein